MTYLEIEKRPEKRAFYGFEGAFTGSTGATFIRCTCAVKSAGGMYRGGLLQPDTVVMGIPQTVGGQPERVSVTLSFDNSDRTLGPWIVGKAAVGAVSLEYGDDSFANLKGRLVRGVFDTDGTLYTTYLTPTLYASGDITVTENTVTVPFSTDDDLALGEPEIVVTCEMIAAGAYVADGTIYYLNGTTAAFSSTDLTNWQELITSGGKSLREVVPLAFGDCTLPVIRAGPDNQIQPRGAHGLLFIKRGATQPSLAAVATTWRFFLSDYESDLGDGKLLKSAANVWTTKVTVTFDDASTETVWVVGCHVVSSRTSPYEPDVDVFVRPTGNLSSDITGYGSSAPSEIIRAVIEESTGGAVNAASFARAQMIQKSGRFVGGAIRGNGPIAGPIGLICKLFGFSLFHGIDNEIHITAHASCDAADKATLAAAGAPLIRAVDIFGDWSETIPRDEDAQGAAVNKVRIEWDEDQRKFWPADVLRSRSYQNISLALGQTRTTVLDGSWLSPARADRVMASIAERRLYLTRRFRFTGALWPASLELGTLINLTMPLGAGLGGAAGYTLRACRLERKEIDCAGDVGSYVFEDLGPAAASKPCVWDTDANWTAYDPAGADARITMTIGSNMVNATTGAGAAKSIFTTAMIGAHLHMPGAANATNRKISHRITGLTGASPCDECEVDYNFAATETIGVVAGGTALVDAAWCVLNSQATKTPTNTDKLAVCDQADSMFRDNATAGFQETSG